jgi:glutamate dehydrogenase
MQRVLGATRTTFTPNELMATILRAPVDVLWNGGIGTYVKASSESHLEAGDRANDAIRVDGADLRCRMVAEGGNLGLTQRGRIEYALAGGLINTDAIDNSAGVDCSDHEVNIKILLHDVMTSTGMTLEERNALLASMTDEVAEQALEFLPTDKQIAERQASGTGLTTPEFAVLLAYTKTTNIELLERSNLPDDPYLEPELFRYFPRPLQERFAEQIGRHRLRREIIATQLGNQMVNISGISFDHRMTEDSGVGVVEISRAWVAARDIVDAVALWDEIDALGSDVRIDVQIDLFLELRRMLEHVVLWLLRHQRPPIDIAATVEHYRPLVRRLVSGADDVIVGRMRDLSFAREAGRLALGVPERLAQRASQWPVLHTFLDVIDLATDRRIDPSGVARAYWQLFDIVDGGWLWDAINSLPRSDRWQTQARYALRDDLLAVMDDITNDALHLGTVDTWRSSNERILARTSAMLTELRRLETQDVTTLTVALRQLRNLALATEVPASG